jgi:phage terminase large subunit
MEGFSINSTSITHTSGGAAFYKGLARNPASIKSVVADGIWVEEGETLSDKTLKAFSASFRISAAKKSKARRAGKEAKIPDIIITMNRGSSNDPISKEYLKDADAEIDKKGWYADEDVLIVQVNYSDIPKQWFETSGLEKERARDERRMSKAQYDHKWLGAYSDSIDNAIIMPEWFDACVDAHKKLEHLGEWGLGQHRVAFDPADVGNDPEAIAYAKGNIIEDAIQSDVKDIEAATNWACSFANEKRVDVFTWDCDGMGIGLKSQVSNAFSGARIETFQFKGSHGAHEPDHVYQEVDEEQEDPKTNKETFMNQRTQFYFDLRDAMFRTWLAVEKGRYFDVDELISFNGTIEHIGLLRSELCRIPRKFVSSGRLRLYTKAEMVAMKIPSPNMADCIMMLRKPTIIESNKPVRLGGVKWG